MQQPASTSADLPGWVAIAGGMMGVAVGFVLGVAAMLFPLPLANTPTDTETALALLFTGCTFGGVIGAPAAEFTWRWMEAAETPRLRVLEWFAPVNGRWLRRLLAPGWFLLVWLCPTLALVLTMEALFLRVSLDLVVAVPVLALLTCWARHRGLSLSHWRTGHQRKR